jgi:hypothetical protein
LKASLVQNLWGTKWQHADHSALHTSLLCTSSRWVELSPHTKAFLFFSYHSWLIPEYFTDGPLCICWANRTGTLRHFRWFLFWIRFKGHLCDTALMNHGHRLLNTKPWTQLGGRTFSKEKLFNSSWCFSGNYSVRFYSSYRVGSGSSWPGQSSSIFDILHCTNSQGNEPNLAENFKTSDYDSCSTRYQWMQRALLVF